MMETTSPFSMVKEMSRRTLVAPKDLLMLLTSSRAIGDHLLSAEKVQFLFQLAK